MPPSTPGFYPPEFTERSRSVLGRVHEAVPDAVLIGGWGTWVRTVTRLIDRAFDYLGDLRLDRNQRRTLNQLARDWHNQSLRVAHDTASPPEPGAPGRGPPGLDL